MNTEVVCSLSPQQLIDELGKRNPSEGYATDLSATISLIQSTKETVGPLEMVLQLAEDVRE